MPTTGVVLVEPQKSPALTLPHLHFWHRPVIQALSNRSDETNPCLAAKARESLPMSADSRIVFLIVLVISRSDHLQYNGIKLLISTNITYHIKPPSHNSALRSPYLPCYYDISSSSLLSKKTGEFHSSSPKSIIATSLFT